MFERRLAISLVSLLDFLAVVSFFVPNGIAMMHMWCSFSHGAKIWMALVGVSVTDVSVADIEEASSTSVSSCFP